MSEYEYPKLSLRARLNGYSDYPVAKRRCRTRDCLNAAEEGPHCWVCADRERLDKEVEVMEAYLRINGLPEDYDRQLWQVEQIDKTARKLLAEIRAFAKDTSTIILGREGLGRRFRDTDKTPEDPKTTEAPETPEDPEILETPED